MSYARIGDDSDVYVWADKHHINMIVRQNLTAADMPAGTLHPLAGQTWDCDLRSDAFHRLLVWKRDGVNVPSDVFDRLNLEIVEKGNKVDN